MEIFWTSAGLVALAEMGDKTQLLAILLAARFRKPVPIILGILCATLLNHAAAAWLGFVAAHWLQGETFQVIVGVAFILMGRWVLIPDAEDDLPAARSGRGVFVTTAIAFFLLEIGDKTQIATSLLAARFHDVLLVTAGTTFGMLAANAPAVLLGDRVTRIIPFTVVRIVAALVLWVTGAWMILDALVFQ